ncbi:hypothetical protein A3844_22630 [Paenibacillus helianthi]|uniref:NERD domain-containing protein n=1 Tax=Paenibacillus helianthi TaxID=1349432 RepID=A0ABX3EJV9_9BACL|nr:hypothetical protein A3844_22630 [Paenibacillus helianthi]OKP92695.1 hypothetical protein A3848_07060 [Paenibacillus sp. P32E]
MTLEHEFYLTPTTIDVEHFWMNRENKPKVIDCLVIYDDIILYIQWQRHLEIRLPRLEKSV